MEGTMMWFNAEKQHGFIRTDDGEQLRVDESGLGPDLVLGERCSGTRVGFDLVGTPIEDARAVNVTALPVPDPRRARTRGRR
jgi:cold shock CspA family protein